MKKILFAVVLLGACASSQKKPAVETVAPVMKSNSESAKPNTTPSMVKETPTEEKEPEIGCH